MNSEIAVPAEPEVSALQASIPSALPFCTLAFNMTTKELSLGGSTNDPSEIRRFCDRLLMLADTMEKLPGYAETQSAEASHDG